MTYHKCDTCLPLWQRWAGKRNIVRSFFPTWALGTRSERVTLHCLCENGTQILHRLKCAFKIMSHAAWNFSTWAWCAAELKMEQSIFCSSLYICKTSLSISGTHFSYRQQLLRYLGTGNDLGEPTGNMAAALLSQKSLVYKCLHMHAGKEMSLLPLLAWLHFPSLRLSPSHFYEHLVFHKSQFPANLNTWSQVLNWNGDSGNLSVIECNIWQVIHSIS